MILDKIKDYGLFGFVDIFMSLVYTKLFFKNCRLIRRPIFIREKKNIKFGKNFTTGRYCRIELFCL